MAKRLVVSRIWEKVALIILKVSTLDLLLFIHYIFSIKRLLILIEIDNL